MSLQSDAVFQKIIDGLKDNEAKAKAVNGVFLYKITKGGKVAKEWSKLKFQVPSLCRNTQKKEALPKKKVPHPSGSM